MTEAEFVRLWQPLRGRLFLRALSLLRQDNFLAEEAVSGVLLSLLRRLDTLPNEGEGGFRLSLYAIYAVKRRAQRLRERERRRRVSLCPLTFIRVDGEEYENPRLSRLAAETGRDSANAGLWQSRLCAVIGRADLNRREARLLARTLAGWDNAEIGASEGLSRERVRQLMARIVSKLQAAADREESAETLHTWDAESLFCFGAAVSLYQPPVKAGV